MEIDPIIKQAIEIGIKLGIEAYRNERNANLKNKKILICRSDAERRFGRGVIRNLEKRKLVFPYQFGIETMVTKKVTKFPNLEDIYTTNCMKLWKLLRVETF